MELEKWKRRLLNFDTLQPIKNIVINTLNQLGDVFSEIKWVFPDKKGWKGLEALFAKKCVISRISMRKTASKWKGWNQSHKKPTLHKKTPSFVALNQEAEIGTRNLLRVGLFRRIQSVFCFLWQVPGPSWISLRSDCMYLHSLILLFS